MLSKRQRPPDTPATHGAKPSKRPKVDLELAQLWENLVDESEHVRLDAVYELLTTFLNTESPENAILIAKRLFRGLCSSRKNARQGFYVALVGALSMKNGPFGTTALSLRSIISLLETQTISELGTSGQDERDHYFGRLLGCKALLESKALWESGKESMPAWNQVLDVAFRLMARKPWLRAESTSVICAAISRLVSSDNLSSTELATVASNLIQQLQNRKLLDTIDGISIWLAVRQVIPHTDSSKSMWTSESPLRKNKLQNLKNLLLDKRQPNNGEQVGDSLSGTSVWSPRLHPTWCMLLRQLDSSQANQIALEEFWQEVVDKGLFDASSTPERKYTGFLVLGSALKELKPQQIEICFSKNLMACLIQSLQSSNESYLRRIAFNVFEEYAAFTRTHESAGVHNLIGGLLRGSDYADFDTLTKTKIVTSLFDIKPFHETPLSNMLLQELKIQSNTEKPISKVATNRKNILNVFSRAMSQAIRGLSADSQQSSWTNIQNILHMLFELREEARLNSGGMVSWDKASYETLQEKISLIVEVVLAAGSKGEYTFRRVVAGLRKLEIDAEETIQESLKASWSLFEVLSAFEDASSTESRGQMQDSLQAGLRLLQAFLLYEVYDGDTSAVEMLEDITSMTEDFSVDQDAGKVADQIVEIVISFLSKSSKFRRRACTLVFEAIAPVVSSEGLESICHILTAKENRDGQQELFEDGGDILSEQTSEDHSDREGSTDSSLEDSDVEVVSARGDVDDDDADQEGAASDNADSDDSTNAESGSEGTSAAGEDEDELARFEGALAAALGTRKLNDIDMAGLGGDGVSESGSDSDMSDSKMMELDDKLAEVFRNQQSQASVQRLRKEEMKSAKENVINLKNRGIDLIELYLRTQHARGSECVLLLVSILSMTRSTSTQQLVNRGTGIVKTFVQRYRGPRLPRVESDASVRENLRGHIQTLLELVTDKDASNVVIDVAGQVNILLCKLLVGAGEEDVQKVITDLSDGQGSQQGEMRKAIEAFWSRYNAWIKSGLGLSEGSKKAAGKNSKGKQVNDGKFAIRGRKKGVTRKD